MWVPCAAFVLCFEHLEVSSVIHIAGLQEAIAAPVWLLSTALTLNLACTSESQGKL
jgi:hypothetical protein